MKILRALCVLAPVLLSACEWPDPISSELTVEIEGLVEILPDPKYCTENCQQGDPKLKDVKRINLLFVNGAGDLYRDQDSLKEHYPALRVDVGYLDDRAAAPVGVKAIFPLRLGMGLAGRKIEITPKTGKCGSGLHFPGRENQNRLFDYIPKLREFAPEQAKCRDTIFNEPKRLLAYMEIDRGSLETSKPIMNRSGTEILNWLFKNPNRQEPWKEPRIDQHLRLKQTDCPGREFTLTLSRLDGSDPYSYPLFAKSGKLAIDLVNLLPQDVLEQHWEEPPTEYIDHFRWFYNLSEKDCGPPAEECVTPEVDPEGPHPGSGGRPYCTFVEGEL